MECHHTPYTPWFLTGSAMISGLCLCFKTRPSKYENEFDFAWKWTFRWETALLKASFWTDKWRNPRIITSLYKLRWTKCKTMELLNEENGMLAENNNYWAKPSCAPKNSWRSPGPGMQNNFFLNLLLWNRSLFFFRNLLLLLPLVIFPRLSNSRWSPSCKNERLARFAPGFSVVPLVSVSRRGLGTKKWWLCRQMIWLARFFDWDFH